MAIAFNFYLADKSEYLEFQDSGIGLPELLFAVGCILALIAFAFYWFFRPKDKVPRSNPNNPDVVYSKYTQQIQGLKDENYEVVDLNKIYGGSVPTSAYSNSGYASNNSPLSSSQNQQAQAQMSSSLRKMATGDQIMTVKLNENLCTAFSSTCGMRIGVLAINGKLSIPPSKIRGNPLARSTFFNDSQINNDFQLLYGKQADLNNYLQNLYVTPFDLSQPTTVLFNSEQLDLSKLDNNGLKTGETLDSGNLSASGTSFTGLSAYHIVGHQTNKSCYYTNSCKSALKCFEDNTKTICKKGFTFFNSDGEVQLRVPLKVYNVNGELKDYNENAIRSNSYYDYNG